MSEAKHTPGPWHFHQDAVHAQYENDGKSHHHWVASTAQPDELATPEQLANARLIAAAQDLLEVIKMFRAGLPWHVFGTMAGGGIPDSYEFEGTVTVTAGELRAIDAAIAKVEVQP